MKKSSKLYSIFNNKCPRCHEGDFYISGQSYNLKQFTKMYPVCPKCGLSYDPEPGYYFGAMYMSYAINVAIMVIMWVGYELFFKESVGIWWLVLMTIAVGLLLTPVIFRWSRLMWINLFVKYDPDVNTSKTQ